MNSPKHHRNDRTDLYTAILSSPQDWSCRHVWQICMVLYLLGLMTARRRYP